MPLIFSLDPDLPDHVRTVTMSYTLFDAGAFAE
jgi:cytochrome c oxidase assembly protein Cox11